MHIINWVRRRPTLLFSLVFALISFAILSFMNSGDSSTTVTKAAAKVGETVEGAVTEVKDVVGDAATAVGDATKNVVEKVKDVDLSIAPKIESSELTKALVSDESTSEATASETSEAEAQAQAQTTEAEAQTTEVSTSGAETTKVAAAEAESTKSPEAASTATNSEATAVSSEFSEAKPQELLLMAREAYWNNGLDESAQIYQQLIALEPEKIEYRGELGNVLWRQGFPKKAAELYASIALPMIEEGNADRVANMVGFIGLYYPEKATEIHNKLESIQ